MLGQPERGRGLIRRDGGGARPRVFPVKEALAPDVEEEGVERVDVGQGERAEWLPDLWAMRMSE